MRRVLEIRSKSRNTTARDLLLLVLILLLELQVVNPQSFAEEDGILLSFSGDALVLDRTSIDGSVLRGSGTDSAKIDVPAGKELFLKVPLTVAGDATPCILGIRSVLLANQSIPGRGSQWDRERLKLWRYQSYPTQYFGISELVPPADLPKLNLYEFDRGDLRDYWGDKQTFAVVGDFARLDIQLRKNLRATVVVPNTKDCFFREGEIIATRLRDFILSRLKSTQ